MGLYLHLISGHQQILTEAENDISVKAKPTFFPKVNNNLALPAGARASARAHSATWENCKLNKHLAEPLDGCVRANGA